MEKFLKLNKKVLLPIFLGIFIIFTIALIIVCCVPHGKIYTYEIKNNDDLTLLSLTYKFKSNNVVEQTNYLNIGNGSNLETVQLEYKIEDGVFFLKQSNQETFDRIGKIDSFKIIVEDSGLSSEVSMKCNANIALRTASIVLMSVFGVFAVMSIILVVLDKKGKLKYGKLEDTIQSNEQVENDTPIE